jgi:ribosomal protein S18 acetylase RimI-like enzyme
MVIKLKLLGIEDLRFLLEVRNDKSTRNNLENNNLFTLNDCEQWFKKTNPEWYVIINSNNENVGYLRTSGDEIGCDIHPKHRRKGYARLAYNEYLKDKDYATLWVFEDNFAKNLYESLGFIENGESKIVRDRKYVRMIWKKLVT